jgi:flagellar biosynthesis protein FlhG
MKKNKTIIPIASGKGGVGKSMLTANLAIALANMGHKTVAVDLDLGGSNLHTYLKIPNTNPGIGDFLKGRHVSFDDLLVQTNIPDLSFIPGDGKTPFMANIPFSQRLSLLDHLQNVPAEYILLDLGAGSTFNTLNFFGLALKSAIVTTFETPAIMNFLVFLRNFIFRVLTSLVRDDKKLLGELISSFRQPINKIPLTVGALLDKVARSDQGLAEKVRKKLRDYRPRIIFNMGEHPDELDVCEKIANTISQSLSIECDFFGFIFFDNFVRKSSKKGEILLAQYPGTISSKSIVQIAKRIIKNWDNTFDDSASLLKQDTKEKYSTWKK